MHFLRFSRKRQDGSAPNFFQELGENTCLATCIEKHCTRLLINRKRSHNITTTFISKTLEVRKNNLSFTSSIISKNRVPEPTLQTGFHYENASAYLVCITKFAKGYQQLWPLFYLRMSTRENFLYDQESDGGILNLTFGKLFVKSGQKHKSNSVAVQQKILF